MGGKSFCSTGLPTSLHGTASAQLATNARPRSIFGCDAAAGQRAHGRPPVMKTALGEDNSWLGVQGSRRPGIRATTHRKRTLRRKLTVWKQVPIGSPLPKRTSRSDKVMRLHRSRPRKGCRPKGFSDPTGWAAAAMADHVSARGAPAVVVGPRPVALCAMSEAQAKLSSEALIFGSTNLAQASKPSGTLVGTGRPSGQTVPRVESPLGETDRRSASLRAEGSEVWNILGRGEPPDRDSLRA